jgi:hypothetical protein
VNLRTGDGSIRLANLKGEMNLQSSDGSQEIESVDGSLEAHASLGRIKAAGRFDTLQLSTSDGRIEAQAQAGSTISSGWDLHAGDGSVTFAAAMPPTWTCIPATATSLWTCPSAWKDNCDTIIFTVSSTVAGSC